MEKKTKNVKMEVVKNEQEAPQKLSYEQLNQACAQLYQQNQQLIRQLEEMNAVNMFKRLDYLFKVLENSSMFGDEFIGNCAKEIQDAITIPQKDSKETSKEA